MHFVCIFVLLFSFLKMSQDSDIFKVVSYQKIIPNSNNVPSLFLSSSSLTHSETSPFILSLLQGLKTYERQPLLISLVFFLYFAFSLFFTVSVLSLFMAWLHVAENMICDSC